MKDRDMWKGPGTGKEPAGAQLAALGFDQIPAARVNAVDPSSIEAFAEEGLVKLESQSPLRYALRAGRRLGRLLHDSAPADDDDGDDEE